MKEILKDIFTKPYQGKSFVLDSLLKPLLGDYKPSNEDILHNSERKKLAENANVKAITRIAEFELEDTTLQVFDITLSSHSKIKYSKVNIQKVVRSIMDVYTGAIMFFHYENNEGDWRISFVEKEDSQKNTTSAKRYTFLVGENHPATTITQRFVTLRGKEKSVEAIRDAFSVEALSEEFFAKYKSYYEDFVQYISGKRFVKEKGKWVEKSIGQPSEEYISIFEENDKSVRDFVKKMLGRIVFLHFLQKKKWLCDDENYLQNLFKKSDKSNYLESVLEPLFFGVLNTKSEDRKVLFENENWDLSLLKEWENVPYLNGGLFEKDELDKKTVVFPEDIFSDLFDFFSQYNFTIDENDPNDSEVGIDPEMLGKIFENLLEDNKDKGAFYTPKEIVQYMCRESLIAYLCEKHKDDEENIRNLVEHHIANWNEDKRNKILDSLKNVKICDPAIGSGAFPMGLLNELYQCRLALGEEKSVNIKKEIIQNNIYGVDIEKGAVDIARLRFWLALVVEEEIAEPLPNLDYKIMQGNSLLESYQGVDLSDLTKTKTEREKSNICVTLFDEQLDVHRFQLSEYIKEYFNCTNSDIKKELRQKIDENIRQQIEEQRISLDFSNINLSANSHFFLWHTYFGDVFNRANKSDNGFDIVIGNPPYFVYQTIHSNEIKYLRNEKDLAIAFGGKLNAYKLFLAKALNSIVKKSGVVSYIFQNSFLGDKQAALLRRYIFENNQILAIDSFPERDSKKKRVFESVKMSVCILFVKNTKNDTPFIVNIWEDKYKSKGIKTLFNRKDIETIDKDLMTIPRIEQKNLSIITKIKSNIKKLEIHCFEGELNMTFHKPYFTNHNNNPIILKGASIQRYYWTKEVSQGSIEYLDKEKYAAENTSEKSTHHKIERIALQGMTGANDKIRIISTIVPKDIFLANSCNYIIPPKDVDIRYLLGIINSKLVNWYFRCFSTNSNVNGYEVDNLPIPLIAVDSQKQIALLVNQIIKSKEENIHNNTDDLEQQIDNLVYQFFRLTKEEIAIIEA